MTISLIAGILSVVPVFLGIDAAFAQDFPRRPLRIIASPPGGGTDFLARVIALGITGPLGQPVIVEGRPAGPIQGELLANAQPDGYTLIATTSSLWLVSFTQKVRFDAVKDFAPITLAVHSNSVLVIHPSVSVNSVKDLIAYGKAKPGELNYAASGSIASSSSLAMELFKSMVGLNIVRIAYKGTGPAMIDLVAGQVQLMFSPTGPAMPFLKSGKLIALAVSGAQPSELFPGLPTVAATVPGYQVVTSYGVLTRTGTPQSIVNRLNREIVGVLNTPEAKSRLLSGGLEVEASTPEQLAAAIKTQRSTLGKIITDAGIRSEK